MSIKKYYILITMAMILSLPQANSQLLKRQKGKGLISMRSNKEEQSIDIHTLTLDENIHIPVIESPLARRKIREYMASQVKILKKLEQRGISKVELIREQDVIKLTIPMDKLFYPNDTTMLNNSQLLMRPIARYGEVEGMYHILVVTHSDNTGSIEYNHNLTTLRAERIVDNLKNSGLKTTQIVTYAMGGEYPITSNFTMADRQTNRRTEIYLIPADEMIRLAQRGRLETK